MNVIDAYKRFYIVAEQVANHLGIDQSEIGYNPMQDDRVLLFIEQATHNEITSESQQVRELDALDREV